ncbi:dnaJ homolog subfamily C member 17 isoform X2 [Balaenoptera acutorostrata]|uniref:DnaJ homolog subfamily C member 17 isoform X2 n=1 Tax=Balaenoptera acutorostrata TaxID=9767 RepID=A0ABM3TBR0_BALAC|nr:dnaJ homolog subfamily C member 17 isoform X2 [Balaenoptera acutorostrata]
MAVAKELLQMDLYALLGIEEEATDKEMKKAYRQKALSCHPDKNPDNPRAAELFHQLSQALEVLTDAAARAAYDKVRKARKQAAERTQKLDERRKKVKLDLEARERQAQAHGSDEEEEEESRSTGTLEQEIRRLREEGSRQLEEQQRVIQEQIRQEREQRLRGMAENPESKGTPKLKLKWKSKKEAKSQGGYSRDVLLRLFQKYGEVLNLVLSSKKAGTAVVEFATIKAAELAVQNEVGLVDNPLKISWLEGRPQSTMGPNHPGLSQIASGQERTSGSQGPAFLWGCLGLTWGPASGEGAGPSLGGEPGWEGNSPRSCRGLGERRRRGAVGKGRGIWAE